MSKLSLLNPFGWFGFSTRGGLNRNEGKQIEGPLSRPAEAVAPVNFDTAMQLSSFWASGRLWAEVIASLPVYLERWDGDMWVKDTDSELARFLGGKWNRYQNRIEFFETFALNHAVFGNAYAQKVYSGNELIGLLPLNSGQVEVELMEDGRLVYYYYHNTGVIAYAEESIWHFKSFGNGVTGLSTLGYARNAVGVGLAADKRVSQVLKNAAKPAGVLNIDKALKPEQRDRIRENFKELSEGPTDQLMVLEGSMKYEKISMSPGDIQLLESRRFQVEDIARFMDVPSVLINDTQNSTSWGSGIHEIIRGWYKKSVRHRVNSLAESMRQSLIPVGERRKSRFCFDFSDLLKLDKAERLSANQKGINAGILTPNEARAEEGREPMEGGDELYANGTLAPLKGRKADKKPNAFVEMAEEDDED